MTDVFLSYKSDNADRVIHLAQSLEKSGLSVWWDRHLASGDNWNLQIQNALDTAKCVVAVWTHESVGPAGDFVRDEARNAKNRNVLVPVKLDKVNPPLGFGEIQAVDLTHWKGRISDPFFQDLLATVKAKIEGRDAPRPKGPIKRLTRRLTYGSLLSAAAFCIAAFGSNTFGVQQRVCSMPLFQPGISDTCGALSLGGRPSRPERVAWETRQPGSCSDLRTFMHRFPNGAYHAEAQSLLAARLVTRTEIWSPKEHRLTLFQPQSDTPSKNKPAAQTAALAEAQTKAERLCKGFAATSAFRFKSAKPDPQDWKCDSLGSGFTCSFDGEAVCQLEDMHPDEKETCGRP